MDEERVPDRNLAKGLAVSVFLALIWGLLLPNPAVDAVVIAAITEEVAERACISQAGPGERLPKPVCALGTRGLPAEQLPYPTAAAQSSFWSVE